MACKKKLQYTVSVPCNQAQDKTSIFSTENPTEGSATPSKNNLSILLTYRSLALTDIPKPILVFATPTSIKKMFKLFIQIYMDTVKNQF